MAVYNVGCRGFSTRHFYIIFAPTDMKIRRPIYRQTSLLLLWLAGLCVVMSCFIPHHHHGSVWCVTHDTFEQASHNTHSCACNHRGCEFHAFSKVCRSAHDVLQNHDRTPQSMLALPASLPLAECWLWTACLPDRRAGETVPLALRQIYGSVGFRGPPSCSVLV